MTRPLVVFNDQISEMERSTALIVVQESLRQSSMQPMLKVAIQKVIDYARNDLIHIEKNVFGKRKVDPSRYVLCNNIFNSLSYKDSIILDLLVREVDQIDTFFSGLRKSLKPIVRFNGSGLQVQFIRNKMNNFITALAPLEENDSIAAGAGIVGFVLSYAATNPLVAFLLTVAGEALYFNTEGRKNKVKIEQEQLTELYNIYRWATAKGAGTTHFNIVLELLSVIAPYLSLKQIMHWVPASDIEQQHIEVGGESSGFYQIMERPPHNIVRLSPFAAINFDAIVYQLCGEDKLAEMEIQNNMKLELQRKSEIHNMNYGYLQQGLFAVKNVLYGLEEKPVLGLRL